MVYVKFDIRTENLLDEYLKLILRNESVGRFVLSGRSYPDLGILSKAVRIQGLQDL